MNIPKKRKDGRYNLYNTQFRCMGCKKKLVVDNGNRKYCRDCSEWVARKQKEKEKLKNGS